MQTSLWNPIENYQNVFVAPAGTNTLTDFVSGAGQFIYSGSGTIDDSNPCNTIYTGEDSNMGYSSVSCGGTECTQNFDASSGYEGHNSPGGSFNVKFNGGWGTNTEYGGVDKGDLLIATEAIYSGGTTFGTPNDTLGDTWTADGGGEYCSANDCVEVWHAVAKSSGPDTVTFHTSNSEYYTYGFLREFVGYTGAVDKSSEGSGTSGTPSVPSFTPTSGDLVIAVAADANGGWASTAYFWMVGGNTGWSAATEFGPAWQGGTTTVPFTAISGYYWAEIAVAYSAP